MPLIKAYKMMNLHKLENTATIVTIGILAYLTVEILLSIKHNKVLTQEKKINEYKLMEYAAKYPEN